MKPNPPAQSAKPGTRMMEIPEALVPEVQRLIERRGGVGGAPQVLDYGRPQDQARRPMTDWPLTIFLAGCAGLISFFMVYIVPKFEVIYKDFGAKLPPMTQWGLNFSHALTQKYGWAPLWAIVIVVPLVVARILRPRDSRSGRGWLVYFALFIGFSALMLVLGYVMLALPIVSLLQSVSGK